jgi:hypothetical protein
MVAVETVTPLTVTPFNLEPCVTARADAQAYVESLVKDLARLLRFASTAKDIDVPNEILEDASRALQAAETQVNDCRPLDPETELGVFKAIDALSPKVYPATTASLEIADIMEVGKSDGTERQRQIRRRINRLITSWIVAALSALILVFTFGAIISVEDAAIHTSPAFLTDSWPMLLKTANFVNPIALGFLGACAYILRSILQGLASRTFVLRDSTSYVLRAILGMILGFMIPNLFLDKNAHLGLGAIAIPFLAGYAVEPMFAALDNIVLTLRDAVSRSPASGAVKPR